MTIKLINLGSDALDPQRPLAFEIARWLLPILGGLTLLKAVYMVFRDSIRWTVLRRRSGHAVICGLSRKGYLLAGRLRASGRRVVIVERNPANRFLEHCRLSGDLVLIGDATSQAVLNKAAVDRARWLFAVCEDDGTNAEIAVVACRVARLRPSGQFQCLAHLDDPLLCQLLTEQCVAEDAHQAARRPRAIVPFSVYELGAPLLLERYDPLGLPRASATAPPRLLMVGLGYFGGMVLVEVARRWRLARSAATVLMPVTVVALDAAAATALLRVRFADDLAACAIETLDLDVLGAEFQSGSVLLDACGRLRFDQAFVCLDHGSRAVRCALTMKDRIGAAGCDPIPIVVRLAEEGGLGGLLRQIEHARAPMHGLNPFALLTETCHPEVIARQAARGA